MSITISTNNKKLRRILKDSGDKLYIIYSNERIEELNELLDLSKEIKINKNDSTLFTNKFVESYLDLIGKLGAKYNSIYWWVTFTSSKNKFVSKLLPDLFFIRSVINILEEKPEIDILIIDPPKTICRSLAKYCGKKSIDMEILSDPINDIYSSIKDILLCVARNVIFIGEIWSRIYLAHKYQKAILNERLLEINKYYVIRSWFYDKSINENNEYHDSFFGALPEYLTKKGEKFVVIAGILGNYRSIVKKISKNKDYLIIPQECFLNYLDPLKSIFNIHRNKIRIDENIKFMELDVTDMVKAEISKDYKYTSSADYLHSYYIKRMLNLFEIGTFVTTYENNPWEKVSFLTLKRYSPSTRIIGYQHSVLSRASVNMFMSKSEKKVVPIPDVVVTVGKVTKRILETYGNYDPDRVREGCALRFEYLFKKKPEIKRKKNNNILLTPEGVFEESVNISNFVYDALKDEEENITIRAHPVLPFRKFQHRLNFDVESNPKITVSGNTSVEDDLKKADVVVYRGSTLAIEALMMGIPVIYIDLGDILSVDPLFECKALKWVVRTEKELVDAIETINSMTDDEHMDKWTEAKKYLNDYFSEINDERLNTFHS